MAKTKKCGVCLARTRKLTRVTMLSRIAGLVPVRACPACVRRAVLLVPELVPELALAAVAKEIEAVAKERPAPSTPPKVPTIAEVADAAARSGLGQACSELAAEGAKMMREVRAKKNARFVVVPPPPTLPRGTQVRIRRGVHEGRVGRVRTWFGRPDDRSYSVDFDSRSGAVFPEADVVVVPKKTTKTKTKKPSDDCPKCGGHGHYYVREGKSQEQVEKKCDACDDGKVIKPA